MTIVARRTRKTLFCKQTSFCKQAFHAFGAAPLTPAKKEGDAMFCCTHRDRPSGIPNLLRKVATGCHKRSCAALLGATTLVSLLLSGPATTPAVAQTPQKPNILF